MHLPQIDEPSRYLRPVLRVGLVGVGKMGLSHLAITRAQPDVEIAGVTDNQRFLLSAIQSNAGLAGYDRFDEMLASAGNLDCVIIATPTASHHELGMLALDRGIGVFIEKPLTLSYAQSRRLAERAMEAGVANQVGYHNRFVGTFAESARLVAAGAIGQVQHVSGSAFGQVITPRSGAGRTWRSAKSTGGGCLHDYACHVVDLMNFVVGPPQEVVGARLSRIFSREIEDAVHAIFVYPDGATGTLETNWCDPTVRKMTTNIVVHGSQGKIYADRQECRVFLREDVQFENYGPGWTVRYITDLQPPVGFYVRGEEYSAQIESFLTACRAKDSTPVNNFGSAAETDRVVEEISRVHAEGAGSSTPARSAGEVRRTVQVPLWLDRAVTRSHEFVERFMTRSRRQGR